MAALDSGLKNLRAPVSNELLLTTREKIILLQGSKLHGCVFPPWREPPANSEFEEDFQDDTEFRFSAEQLEVLRGWSRPEPIRNADPAMRMKVDLVQDVTTDCSVVASLCASTARAERLGAPFESILTSIMHPNVGMSTNGKYVFKLQFNGCFRKVIIDDRLPMSKTSRTLHVFDRSNPDVFWPALVEKAYLKVRGGYDFPGSNSGTDLWVLTGWIPEQLFLQSEDIVPHAFWKRIYNAFNYGDVLVTIGTGRLSLQEEKALGLAGEHAYAIIDMKEEEGRRLFLIKNPWSEGGVWTGSIDSGYDQSVDRAHPREALVPGTFWMDLNNIFQNFDTIYLNWNPGLFSHRRDVHFTWDLESRSSKGLFDKNPQYSLYSEQGGTTWLLLSKHFQTSDSIRERSGENEDQRIRSGFLSLYAFENTHRITLTDGSVIRGPYVDAPNILLRFELPPKTSYIIVVSEQDLPRSNAAFTLSAFSLTPLSSFRDAEEKYSHFVTGQSAWTHSTAGGNSSSHRFNTNPQFKFVLPQDSDVALVIESEKRDLAINVKLVWAGGKRICPQITTRDVVGDSGEYRRASALAEIRHVMAGTYTIVCSTFKEGQLGKFSLRVRSRTGGCILKYIPIEEAGMLVSRLPVATFSNEVDRLLAPLKVVRITRIRVQAKSTPASSTSLRSPMKLSLEYGQGPNKRILITTGEFVFAPGGLKTDDIDITPRMCADGGPGIWLVVERVGGSCVNSVEESQIEVLCSEHGVTVGAWGKESNEPVEKLQKKLASARISK